MSGTQAHEACYKMAMECQECGKESEELTAVKEKGKKRKLCPECLEVWEEQREVEAEAGRAMREMMEYKG